MKRQFTYIPLPTNKNNKLYLSVPFGKLAWMTVSLPLFGFLFCVIWSISFHFESSTFTHCNVYNFLPSVSAAIGNFTPQKHVWRATILTHAAPRFMIAIVYYRHHHEVLFPKVYLFNLIGCILNITENLALIGLTLWTSNENYPIHKFCFMTFVVMSELYMLLICTLLQWYRKFPSDNIESRSLQVKWKLFIFNILCFILAGYCFMRHNWYCEAGVYSLFALFEYFVVLSNMGFHSTARWDFHGRYLILDQTGFYLS